MYKNISRFCCSVKIATGAVVCVESEIRGDVTIGKTMPSNRSSENLLFSHSRSVPRQELNGCNHCSWLLAAPLFLQAPGPWSTQKLASLLRQDPLSSEKATWLKSKLWSLTGYLRPRCTMFSTRLTIVDHLWWSVTVLTCELVWSSPQLPRKYYTWFWGGTKNNDHRYQQRLWSWLWYPFI